MSTWTQSHGETGAFASIQRASLPQRVVELSAAGAERLGDLYSPASPVRSSKDSDIPTVVRDHRLHELVPLQLTDFDVAARLGLDAA